MISRLLRTPGKYLAKDLPGLKECKTLCPTAEPELIKFTKVGDKYMVGTGNIVKADDMATNGVIHVLDTVILPPSMDIVDTAAANPQFSTLVAEVGGELC